ncbi:MAG: HAD-IIA family hydrolase [Microcella pacifica]|uniref:HAD-IIA family hydrolase n=1 Tax=Microcella pacifica TaxID=2591847 RepID=A0A9E5JMH4_9MICO|nr:HAD-IIA family hydrolase [Microcella pacifica]MBR22962.1 haloacid dehalogenase [Leifsonia sp.]MBU1251452.1 HAD-IIA family hydrolase [Actinomycetota bacterium]MBU1609204.1 HAD-IIA family hydrolase [Actinomycetota bacterium]MBU2314779.1 HAD-IIA family hydrolase [Actinomycetota bacterium]MBU2384994.1 HAD-IIA family hydrolase [Actinomycetota bacterium]
MPLGKRRHTPLTERDALLLDLDGVVYTGPGAIPHAVESITRAAESVRVGYITNNASRTDEAVAEHLSELGLSVAASDVVTSPQAAVRVLADLVEPGSRILVVGGDGLVSEVENAGFTVTRSAEDDPAAVIQGFAPHVGWEHLAEASFALHTGIPWVATNTDWTIPVARGIAPGNGTLVSAVHLAVGRLPVFAGKPEKPIFDVAAERFGARNALVVGDRLDTDILGGNRAGMATALVLTGIDRAKQVLAAPAGQHPDYILTDLRQLFEAYPDVRESVEDGVRTVEVGKAVVRMKQHVVRVARAGDPLDLLRAGAAVIHSSGLQIFALDVDEQLRDLAVRS